MKKNKLLIILITILFLPFSINAVVRNNYDIYWEKQTTKESGTGVFNGEFGTIIDIDEKEKSIEIKFDDEKIAVYQFSDLEQIEHSYSITIHKAQRK